MSQSKTLLAYVTAGGATERYAQAVADTLRSRGVAVDLADLKREKVVDLSPYGSVIVGTGVRMGMVYRKAKGFLARKDLAGKRIAVFLSSGVAIESPEKAREKFLDPLLRRLGLVPVAAVAFPGTPPGPAGKLNDRVDLEVARRWATELSGQLAALT